MKSFIFYSRSPSPLKLYLNDMKTTYHPSFLEIRENQHIFLQVLRSGFRGSKKLLCSSYTLNWKVLSSLWEDWHLHRKCRCGKNNLELWRKMKAPGGPGRAAKTTWRSMWCQMFMPDGSNINQHVSLHTF